MRCRDLRIGSVGDRMLKKLLIFFTVGMRSSYTHFNVRCYDSQKLNAIMPLKMLSSISIAPPDFNIRNFGPVSGTFSHLRGGENTYDHCEHQNRDISYIRNQSTEDLLLGER